MASNPWARSRASSLVLHILHRANATKKCIIFLRKVYLIPSSPSLLSGAYVVCLPARNHRRQRTRWDERRTGRRTRDNKIGGAADRHSSLLALFLSRRLRPSPLPLRGASQLSLSSLSLSLPLSLLFRLLSVPSSEQHSESHRPPEVMSTISPAFIVCPDDTRNLLYSHLVGIP